MTQRPTQKQIDYALALAVTRVDPEGKLWADRVRDDHGVDIRRWVETRTRKACSIMIDVMKASPRADNQPVGREVDESESERAPDPPEGVHRDADGRVYRVQKGRESGNFYASEMVPPNSAGTLVNGADYTNTKDKPEFLYVGRRPFRDLWSGGRLSDETLLTFDEAVELSAQFGFCIRCGRKLTAEMSASLGIGPVCGKALHEQERARRKSEKTEWVRAQGVPGQGRLNEKETAQ